MIQYIHLTKNGGIEQTGSQVNIDKIATIYLYICYLVTYTIVNQLSYSSI